MKTGMKSFRDFVVGGHIGKIKFDLSTQEIIRLLGPPADWLDKETIVHKVCPKYEESELWFYYGGSVGVRFNDVAVSTEILLYPDKFLNCAELFEQWDMSGRVTMGRWRTALVENEIIFRESNPDSLHYWIVAAESCVAFGFPSNGASPPKGYERSIDILVKYKDTQSMIDDCKFID